MTHILKFRKKVYHIDRDAHCFILSIEKVSQKKETLDETYTVALGFYKELEHVIRALINLHCLDHSDLSIIDSIRLVCDEMRECVTKTVKAFSCGL